MLKNDKLKEWCPILFFLIVNIVFHFILSNYTRRVEVFPDEIRYYDISRNVFYGNGIKLLNADTTFQKILYSLFIAPSFLIKNGIIRLKVLTLINSIIMSLAIIPSYLICKELKLDKKWKYLVYVLLVISPDMIYSMTYMAEILFWPLFLLSIWLWIYNHRKQNYFISFLSGVLCYMTYFCKEISLVLLLAYIGYECLEIFLHIFLHLREKKELISEVINLVIYIAGFVIVFYLFKLTLFSGMGNSYNQMGLEAILGEGRIVYLLYGFIYYLVSILFACFFIPFIIPVLGYNELNEETKSAYKYIMILLLGTAATIAYTITVREDFGRIAPRAHMRYCGPAVFVMLIIFIKAVSVLSNVITNKMKAIISMIFGTGIIISVFLFKGFFVGSAVDQFSLFYYMELCSKLGERHFLINIIIAVIVIGIYLLFLFKKKKIAVCAFSIVLIISYVISNRVGINLIKSVYPVDDKVASSVMELVSFLDELNDDKNVLYLTTGDTVKTVQSYCNDMSNIYIEDAGYFLASLENCANSKNVSEIDFRENMYYMNINPEGHIDYIVKEKSVDFGMLQLSGVNRLDELCDDNFEIYENVDVADISLDNVKSFDISCSNVNYNASSFVKYGLSGMEGDFSWTDGTEVAFTIPCLEERDCAKIEITITGTYNGEQSFVIKQGDNVIKQGCVNGSSVISFEANCVGDGYDFEIQLPNAVSPADLEGVADGRVLALQIANVNVSFE